MMKKRMFIAIIIVIQLVVTGCDFDGVEVGNIAIVSGMAIDQTEDNQVLISVLIPVTRASGFGGLSSSSSSSSKESTVVLSEKGVGVTDAYRKIESKLSRRIFFSQTAAVFIGQKLAETGVRNIVDFISRNDQSHLGLYIFITKGQAVKILNTNSLLERSIVEKFVKQQQSGIDFKTTFLDFINMVTEDGMNPIVPIAATEPADLSGNNNYINAGILGAAVFRGYKMIGSLTRREARGAVVLCNKCEPGMIAHAIDDSNEILGMKVMKCDTKIIPRIDEKNKLVINVVASVRGYIQENTTNIDLSTTDGVIAAKQRMKDTYAETLNITLRKLQRDLKCDAIGFGAAVYRKYPKQWNEYYSERWEKEFQNVKINLIVNMDIPNVGLQGKRFKENCND